MRIISRLKNMPKKVKIICTATLAVALVCCMASGYLLAYLIKPVDARVNNMTVGNIKIELTEKNWDKLPEEERVVYPEKELPKDPVIKNISDTDNDAYVFIKISVPYRDVKVYEGSIISQKAKVELFTYKINSDWTQLEGPVVSSDGFANEYVYVYNTSLAKEQSTSAVFDSVKFANVLEGELPMNEKLSISVDALAIQKDFAPLIGNNYSEQTKYLYENYLKNT